jgi:hypothetical protein
MSERTVPEKYHDEIVHCAQVEIVKRDKRIEQLEALADARLKDRLIMQESNVTAHKRIEQLEAQLVRKDKN